MKLNYSGTGSLTPFPHTIVENLVSPETVKKINDQWPMKWEQESGRFTKKWNTQYLPQAAREVIDSINIAEIEQATGIDNLIADPDLYGAGLHCIPRGGFLKMHCDFNYHPNGWRRRVNVLIYLNQNWHDDWGGHLILSKSHKPEGVEIAPVGGRCVIFETNDKSWHGHPEPLACPESVQRRSLALYFYTNDSDGQEPRSTVYKK